MTAPRRRLIVKAIREQFHASNVVCPGADLARSTRYWPGSFVMNRCAWLELHQGWPVNLDDTGDRRTWGPGPRGVAGQQEGGAPLPPSAGAEKSCELRADSKPHPEAWTGSERLPSPAVAVDDGWTRNLIFDRTSDGRSL